MRIAVATWSARLVGGAEAYLATLAPGLAARGHALALWHEADIPLDRAPLAWPGGPAWNVAQLGRRAALAALAEWKPDVIYLQGLLDPGLDAALVALAPTVLFAHGYYGSCISGTKTFMRPTPRPCARTFGPGCFAHYYPHRCGGLNPLSMLREYAVQSARRSVLGRYRAVVTASEHMGREMERHGANATAVGLPAPDPSVGASVLVPRPAGSPIRLLFVGRMDATKGGDLLLAALPTVAARAGRPVTLTFVGDGPARSAWERAARQVMRHADITFAGWVDRTTLARTYGAADVLALPSVWPEPFGLVGLEAASYGVPTAAFAVGGIPEWLAEGENGHLAPGDIPQPSQLADAMLRCVADAAHHLALRRSARTVAQRFSLAAHLDRLLPVLSRAAGRA